MGRKEYDIVFLTNLSSFYKINLYNEIVKNKKILVIFISKKSNSRAENFFKGIQNYDYIYLSKKTYEKKELRNNIFKLIKILTKIKYKRIILGGWDSIENWIAWMITSKLKNSVVIESTEFESKYNGIKGFIKKIFLKRISLAFVPGESHKNLLIKLGYKNEIKKTKGVGIFNYKKNDKNKNIKEIKNFLFVGRLIKEKNLEQLIRVFNKMPELKLNIIGYGELEDLLKSKANSNIKFLGEILNEKLYENYSENDVLLLPSLHETWGVVVEEALFNRLPVILSDKVGCSTEILKDQKYGFIYDVSKDEDLISKIKKIKEIETYEYLVENIKNIDFDLIKKNQVEMYL